MHNTELEQQAIKIRIKVSISLGLQVGVLNLIKEFPAFSLVYQDRI